MSHPVGIDEADRSEVARGVHAVVDVGDAPLAIERRTIRAPVAGAATIVDVHDREPSVRPVLDIEVECAWMRLLSAAVTDDDQRRPFARPAPSKSGVLRPIEEGVRHLRPRSWRT